ncbi:MAG: hypothetical protein V4472_24990 [Pseudomonadota bacterium]
MSVSERSTPPPTEPFDPYEPDCFARWINKTNDEVSALLVSIAGRLASQGEYDQGDTAALDWDDARDLVVVAEFLWARTLTLTSDTEQGDSEDRITRERTAGAEMADAINELLAQPMPNGLVDLHGGGALRARLNEARTRWASA